MRLSPTARDHFANPRHLGTLEDATHVAQVSNPVCGDVLRLALRVTGQRITAARFQAEGCAPTLAAGSVLAERLVGQPVAWALSVEPAMIIAWLDGLPPGKEHVAHLAVEALRTALRSPLDRHGPSSPPSGD